VNKAVVIGIIIAAIILAIVLVFLSSEFGLEESAPVGIEESVPVGIKGNEITVELSESIGLTSP